MKSKKFRCIHKFNFSFQFYTHLRAAQNFRVCFCHFISKFHSIRTSLSNDGIVYSQMVIKPAILTVFHLSSVHMHPHRIANGKREKKTIIVHSIRTCEARNNQLITVFCSFMLSLIPFIRRKRICYFAWISLVIAHFPIFIPTNQKI